MNNLTFGEVLEEIKSSGETEKRTIEVADELARIIGSLAEARVKRSLTQRQLAEKSGIKQSAIARMESLQAIPRLDTMIKIARCLDVRINIDSSSSKIIGVDVLIDIQKYMTKPNQYMWCSSKTNSRNVSYSRKEPAYAAIG
jgi:transcriptional regulator with XRE-family HTH domain